MINHINEALPPFITRAFEYLASNPQSHPNDPNEPQQVAPTQEARNATQSASPAQTEFAEIFCARMRDFLGCLRTVLHDNLQHENVEDDKLLHMVRIYFEVHDHVLDGLATCLYDFPSKYPLMKIIDFFFL